MEMLENFVKACSNTAKIKLLSMTECQRMLKGIDIVKYRSPEICPKTGVGKSGKFKEFELLNLVETL